VGWFHLEEYRGSREATVLQWLGSACLQRGDESEARTADATDPFFKQDYVAIAAIWHDLAGSYQFSESLERFLLDADKLRRSAALPQATASISK
jgi:hypothetical protein